MANLNSSFVGLFWFSEDYSEIIRDEGVVEFFESDIALKNIVLPDGAHRSYESHPYNLPRGRIEVEGGSVIISVGFACPDKIIEKIIQDYGLRKYRSVIKVKRSSFWDKRFL